MVNDAPTLTITAPSEEGSTDDFATTILGNPDMNALSDVDQVFGLLVSRLSASLQRHRPVRLLATFKFSRPPVFRSRAPATRFSSSTRRVRPPPESIRSAIAF